MDAAACIGCGACVAACPNASAMLFTSAKVSQLNYLPQGAPEKDRRTIAMVEKMDELGFGNCSNYGECQAACPKGITLDFIAKMNQGLRRREGEAGGFALSSRLQFFQKPRRLPAAFLYMDFGLERFKI